MENSTYINRWGTFNEGEGYVGINASKDEKFLEDTIMRVARTAWKKECKYRNAQIVNQIWYY